MDNDYGKSEGGLFRINQAGMWRVQGKLSAHAVYSFILVYVDGTSGAAPVFAAMVTLLDSRLTDSAPALREAAE